MWNLIWQTMRLQMKQSFARPMYRFCLLVGPLMNTIFLYEEFLYSGQENLLQYVAMSAGLMGLWGCICFSSVGDINRERYIGTLPLIYVAPGGFGWIVIGKVLGNTLLSMLSFVITYAVTALLSRNLFFVEQPVYFMVAFLLLILCFLLISVCFAYILMISRKTELYMNLLEVPLILLCGFTFPVDCLPMWVQYISHMVPATWAVKLFRMSISFTRSVTLQQHQEFIHCCMILILELLLMVIVTVCLLQFVDRMIRKHASLEVA